jgi:hypothetical protein
MKQRVENRRGQYPQWAGRRLEFTRREFIEWAKTNRPPNVPIPSIDRIDPLEGYAFANIQWLDMRQNSRGHAKHLPLNQRYCHHCNQIKELNSENFHRNRSDSLGYQSYCKSCRATHYRHGQRVNSLV